MQTFADLIPQLPRLFTTTTSLLHTLMTIKDDPIPTITHRPADSDYSSSSSAGPSEREPLLPSSSTFTADDVEYAERYDSVAAPPSYNSISQDQTVALQNVVERERRRKRREKFLFGTFLLFIFSSVTIFFLTISKKEQGVYLPPPGAMLSDGNIVANASWSDPILILDKTWYRTASFSLPISAPSLFFHTSGKSHTTSIDVRSESFSMLDEDDGSSDTIKVWIEASYSHPILFDTFEIYQLRQIHGSGEGIGLYQDDGNSFKEDQFLRVNVIFQIPRVKRGSEPIYLPFFKASATGELLMDQNLGNSIRFGSFVGQMGQDITIRSLSANSSIELHSSGNLRSSSELISPKIEASANTISLENIIGDWITLDANAGETKIINMTAQDVRIRSLSLGEITTALCTLGNSLEIESASGLIDVQMILKGASLLSSNSTSTPTSTNRDSEVRVQAATALGSVKLNYLEINPNVILTSSAGTLFGKVEVDHPKDFVGDFSLESLNSYTLVEGDSRRVKVREKGQLGETGSFLRGEVVSDLDGEDLTGTERKGRRTFSTGYSERGVVKMNFG